MVTTHLQQLGQPKHVLVKVIYLHSAMNSKFVFEIRSCQFFRSFAISLVIKNVGCKGSTKKNQWFFVALFASITKHNNFIFSQQLGSNELQLVSVCTRRLWDVLWLYRCPSVRRQHCGQFARNFGKMFINVFWREFLPNILNFIFNVS